ncbi:NVEALA domain-containing protein [Bacteroidales bacterium OttesenSCG-928-L03]|nr:NVEALA domain-containing protein [Bacteroidales bacterium OttesenSCG-928-L03]
MKKIIIGSIAIVVIAVAATFNVNVNTSKDDLSLLSLANVEALANELNWPWDWGNGLTKDEYAIINECEKEVGGMKIKGYKQDCEDGGSENCDPVSCS